MFTLAVLWPPRRPGWLVRVVFVLTHLLNEAPVIGWIWLLVSTVLAAAGGQLASVGGIATAALAAVTAAGLIEVTRRGMRTGRAVDDALTGALGSSRAPRDRPAQGQRFLNAVRELLLPLPWRPRRVRRIRNLRYGPHGRHNLLDIYLSRDEEASPRPVLIHFHGGHFQVGAKSREALPLLHHLAARRWLCISANYRLGSAGRFPNAHIDAKRIIVWARSEAARYGADPTTVYVAGSSAGAHLAAITALTANNPHFQPEFEADNTAVAGAVCLCGYYGRLDTGQPLPSTARTYIRRDAPPFLIAHGTNDTLVPFPDAMDFADQLAATTANPVVRLTLPRRPALVRPAAFPTLQPSRRWRRRIPRGHARHRIRPDVNHTNREPVRDCDDLARCLRHSDAASAMDEEGITEVLTVPSQEVTHLVGRGDISDGETLARSSAPPWHWESWISRARSLIGYEQRTDLGS